MATPSTPSVNLNLVLARNVSKKCFGNIGVIRDNDDYRRNFLVVI